MNEEMKDELSEVNVETQKVDNKKEKKVKKQKKTKMSNKLKNIKMDKKFKKSFTLIQLGFILIAVIGILCIAMLSVTLHSQGYPITRGLIASILILVTALVDISLCKKVSKSLEISMTEPIYEIQGALKELKEGNYNINITYESQDELGELASNLQEVCLELNTVINDAGYLLGEMSDGKFNVTSKVEDSYVGDLKKLILAMNKLSGQMNETLHSIKESSEHVMLGAEQLASSAQDLAEGANSQAEAVDELTATIENVTNISEESAVNAVKAAKSAKHAAIDAEKSREEINKLTSAMDRITETSKEIEKIIVTIEDIASQTNLLALNASIEAARAGEAGRGFAVVADEIAKLASDSAQSVENTKELITKALMEIETGNGIVDYTIESIGTVLNNMEAFAKMASGAAEASKVQADMLKQIEHRIEEITTVVQNNSAAAEETSAISEELSAQSVGLEDMISIFELK